MNAVEFVKLVGLAESKRIVRDNEIKGLYRHLNVCHVDLLELERLVDSYELVKKIGLKNSKLAIENNALDASYISVWGTYYRYGAHSLYMVEDGKWKEIYTGMDSNNLIHLDALKEAIRDVESVGGGV